MASTVSLVANSPAMTWAGSPGSDLRRIKTMREIPTRTGSVERRRLTTVLKHVQLTFV